MAEPSDVLADLWADRVSGPAPTIELAPPAAPAAPATAPVPAIDDDPLAALAASLGRSTATTWQPEPSPTPPPTPAAGAVRPRRRARRHDDDILPSKVRRFGK